MEGISLTTYLRRSFSLLFSNLPLFIPYLISIVVTFAIFMLPFADVITQISDPDMDLSPGVLLKFIVLVLLAGIISALTYGWLYAAIRPVVEGKELSLFSELRPGIRLSLTLLAQLILILLLFGAVMILGGIVAMLIFLSFMISYILAIVLIAVGAVFGLGVLFSMMSNIMFAGAAVMVRRCGAIESIKQGFEMTKTHKKMALKMVFLSILVLAISYIPLIPFLAQTSDGSFADENFVGYTAISTLLGIPSMVAMTAIFIFYGLVFKELSKVQTPKPALKRSGAKKDRKKK